MNKKTSASRFEKLNVWIRAKNLAVEIYKVSSTGPFGRDWGLRDQIRKAAVSVPSNIAEGQGRYSRKEFRNFLSIANGSLYEVITHLHIARDLGYIDLEKSQKLVGEGNEISRMIKGLRNSLTMMN
jgi:four helix bundle protein